MFIFYIILTGFVFISLVTLCILLYVLNKYYCDENQQTCNYDEYHNQVKKEYWDA